MQEGANTPPTLIATTFIHNMDNGELVAATDGLGTWAWSNMSPANKMVMTNLFRGNSAIKYYTTTMVNLPSTTCDELLNGKKFVCLDGNVVYTISSSPGE